jgi:hypothetical protein
MFRSISTFCKIALLAGVAIGTSANAAITIAAVSGNLLGFEYTVDTLTNKIAIEETWGPVTAGNVRLQITGLTGEWDIDKVVHNDTGKTWVSFGHELLNGDGSWSDDGDGLSFAQGSSLPRHASAFSSLHVDELGTRDYLNWFGPPSVASGSFVVFEYGLRDNTGSNDPFYLIQTANVLEPESWALMIAGLGMVGATMRRSRRMTTVTA